MDTITFVLKSAFLDFSRNKGRTFLTSLGILIGVMAVVLLTAFGLGLRAYIEQQFEDLGSNLIRVVPGQLLQDGNFSNAQSAFTSIEFDENDVLKLSRIREIKTIVPVYSKTLTVTAGNEKKSSTLYASTAGIFTALNLNADYGKLFTEREVDKRSKIIVIGPKLAEDLFLSAKKAVGKQVKIDGQSYTIMGVTNGKGGGFGGPDFDSFTYMPYKTAYTFNTNKTFMAIILQTRNESDIKPVIRKVKEVLLKTYDEDEFSVIQQEELLSAIGSIFSIINTVLVAIAAISLIVGGIGIMNIMYVTVTERIKEIGIRRALGARKSDILWQFLTESIILSLIGGLSGLLISYIIVVFIQAYFPAYIDLQSVILALGVSSVIGIVFGVFPAKKAADLSPIDAIRYE